MATKKSTTAAKSTTKKPAHPPWVDMIKECIASHTEEVRIGVSRPQIKKFVETKYKIEISTAQNTQLSKALSSGSEKGVFVLPKGPSGRVKLAPKTKAVSSSATEEDKLITKPKATTKPAAKAPTKSAVKSATKLTTRSALKAYSPEENIAKKTAPVPKTTTTKKPAAKRAPSAKKSAKRTLSHTVQSLQNMSPSDNLYPGFGLPLDFVPSGDNRELFISALDENSLLSGKTQLPLTTLREFTMLGFMNKMTDKRNWHKEVFNEVITSKWKAEALSEKHKEDMTEKMVDWCLAELQYKAGIFERTGAVTVYNEDVVKSDTAIPNSLRAALKAAVAPLENVHDGEKDWHPGTDNVVLDLVHPSLYPLVYGRTRILPDSLVGLDDCIERSGEGVTVEPEAPEPRRGYAPFSEKFQWLPCEVDISRGQGNVKIKSYINNLHPVEHRPLYPIIAEIISKTIPLWNMTLTPLRNPSSRFQRIYYNSAEYRLKPGSTKREHFSDDDDDDDDDYQNQINSELVLPEPDPFSPAVFDKGSSKYPPVDIWKDFADRGLQIIVKLFNIHLTPQKPEYDPIKSGVEGQLNEHICASALYCYDSNNISSGLAFNQQSDADQGVSISYEHNPDGRYEWLEKVFGCQQDDAVVQYVGTVDTLEGRLITWPNILERRLRSTQLKDRKKPGHQKILALYLVDPHIRIISTANVPCQQLDWWADAVSQGQNAVSSLPTELQKQIFGDVDDFPIGMEEAQKLRLALMEERRAFESLQSEGFWNVQFLF